MKYDPASLDLYLAHRTALIDYAAPIVGCRARAEDVVQEAYLRFTAAADRVGGDERILEPLSYLYRVVRNLALDWARRLALEPPSPAPDLLEHVAASTSSPELTALYRDELRILAEALAELPERTRQAFEMRRLGGQTFHVIADRLGISVGLAHRLVKDALTHCASRLDEPGP